MGSRRERIFPAAYISGGSGTDSGGKAWGAAACAARFRVEAKSRNLVKSPFRVMTRGLPTWYHIPMRGVPKAHSYSKELFMAACFGGILGLFGKQKFAGKAPLSRNPALGAFFCGCILLASCANEVNLRGGAVGSGNDTIQEYGRGGGTGAPITSSPVRRTSCWGTTAFLS